MSGPVTSSTLQYGIKVSNGSNANDLAISQIAGNISAAGNGILDHNNGSGTTSLTMAGSVTSGAITGGGSFTMAAPLQAGAYEYVLQQGGATSGGESWYLTSTYTPPPPDPDPNPDPDPVVPPTTDPVPPITIYRPGVANYAVAQTANIDLGLLQLSNFHQRMGAQRAADGEGRQTWLRPYSAYQSREGSQRFEYDNTMVGLQFGQEVYVQRGEGGTTMPTPATGKAWRVRAARATCSISA